MEIQYSLDYPNESLNDLLMSEAICTCAKGDPSTWLTAICAGDRAHGSAIAKQLQAKASTGAVVRSYEVVCRRLYSKNGNRFEV